VLLAAVKLPDQFSVVNSSEALAGAFTDLGIAWDSQPAGQPADQPAAPPADEPAPRPADQSTKTVDEPQPEIAADGAENEVAMSKRILTIDDSKTMRDMLMMTLQGSGFEVIQAVDGQDGLDVLAREKNVDVIITDINMPKMDGYGVLEHVRKNPVYDATPILVLTTESDTEKKERARGLGATGFIVKPFNPISLVEVIRKVSP
jgi:two-component system chemotaxis response regulator CheY